MKCPKCGKENEEGAIFCENCDWKLNMKYGGEKMAVNSVYFSFAAVALGIAALVTAFLVKVPLAAVICGAIGMFLGGYTQSFVRITGMEGDIRTKLVVIAVVGLLMSVIGFVYGFANLSF
ncbi:MAG: zinc ribbon domain-containing protein [Candidatus Methanomethylophilaceae archaeon]|nr:zinc ribbon domain-containing protein [Candidatus Methanomethylophilaceae archaeon]MDY5871703.1 zinc ribbon domain-containing protein [Candidatus Methanomethylophilaceae archaeon]